jgi:hypothetical protein
MAVSALLGQNGKAGGGLGQNGKNGLLGSQISLRHEIPGLPLLLHPFQVAKHFLQRPCTSQGSRAGDAQKFFQTARRQAAGPEGGIGKGTS